MSQEERQDNVQEESMDEQTDPAGKASEEDRDAALVDQADNAVEDGGLEEDVDDDIEEEEEEETLGAEAEVEELSPVKVRLKGHVPAEKVQQIFKENWRELADQVQIRGFRRGKIPRDLLKRRVGSKMDEEIEAQLKQSVIAEVTKAHGIYAVGKPEFEKSELTENEPYHFSIVTDRVPDFAIPPIEDIALEKAQVTVSEEAVDEALERMRNERGSMEVVDEWPPKMGDMILGRLCITASNKVFNENDAFPFTVGATSLYGISLPTLTEQVLAGDKSLSFEVRVPEDHNNELLRARKAKITLDVTEVKRRQPADVTDEWAAQFQCKTVDELKDKIRNDIKGDVEKKTQSDLGKQALEKMLERVDFPLPEYLLKEMEAAKTGKKPDAEEGGQDDDAEAEEKAEAGDKADIDEKADAPESDAAEEKAPEADADAADEAAEATEEVDAAVPEDPQADGMSGEEKAKRLEDLFRRNVLISRIAEAQKIEVEEEELDSFLQAGRPMGQMELLQMKRRLAMDGSLGMLQVQLLEYKVCQHLADHCRIEGEEQAAADAADNAEEAAAEEVNGKESDGAADAASKEGE